MKEDMSEMACERPLVLVVDGEREVLEKMTAVLGQAGFGCRCCATAAAAESAARDALPDLIVCDLNLGGENGLEACQRIKDYPGLEDVPVMFLSGAQLPDVISRSHMAGGSYCLRKPFAPAVLVELIDQALSAPVAR
jgi:CheY-like chemotaxis protein